MNRDSRFRMTERGGPARPAYTVLDPLDVEGRINQLLKIANGRFDRAIYLLNHPYPKVIPLNAA